MADNSGRGSAMLDIEELKRRAPLATVVRFLELELSQDNEALCGQCPACQSGKRRDLVVTPGKGFFCFSAKVGGDQLALIRHIRQCDETAAVSFLERMIAAFPLKAEMPRQLARLDYLLPE